MYQGLLIANRELLAKKAINYQKSKISRNKLFFLLKKQKINLFCLIKIYF
jgi:hypothetical protein